MYANYTPSGIRDFELPDTIRMLPADWDLEKPYQKIYFHKGRTDQNGGHHDWLNRMGLGLGAYHYHHGLSAHLHTDGNCPYGKQKTSIINPFTGKIIDLGTPYYYDGDPYFSLNLVSKALTVRDDMGAQLESDNTGGIFHACATGDSIPTRLGKEFTFAYPKFLFSLSDNTLFATGNGELSLLCHTEKAELDDMSCYAYISLATVREHMLKDGYFTSFSDSGAGIWRFMVRRPRVHITFPDRSTPTFKDGDALTVKANISNADSAKLIIGQYTEAANTLLNQREVTFRPYILAEADVGSLTLKVEVNAGGTALGTATVTSSVLIQVGVSNGLMIKNLEEDTTLGLGDVMKKTMVGIGHRMLDEGYEPAYVAGMLANIAFEGGTAGLFEDSTYISDPSGEPKYIQYMDDNYDYRAEYAGESITDKKLSTVYALLEDLEEKGWPGGFGIGSVQWSFDRAKILLDIYKDVAGGNDTITFEQVLNAECLMIIKELEGDYAAAKKNWTSINQDSIEAAYDAGVVIHDEYEQPYENTSKERGEIAKAIYAVMRDISAE